MTQYQPYDNPRKLARTYERAKANLSETENNNIKKLSVAFRSENHYKPVIVVPIVTKYPITVSGQQISVDLIDFPDWAINMANPHIVLEFDSALRPHEEVVNFSTEFANGTLVEGDLSISRWHTERWFVKVDGFYIFTLMFDFNTRIATGVSPFGFSSIAVPVYATVSLYILNERNYNELQSG